MRSAGNVDADVADVLAWVARNTAPVSALADPATMRRMLDAATTTLTGSTVAASPARRNRAILSNAMEYARELRILDTNPIPALKWKAAKVSGQVDRRSVVNPRRARALLEAIRAQRPSGPRLVAFFGVMYYAALRPEEAINLRKDEVTLPPLAWNDSTKQWRNPPRLTLGRTASPQRLQLAGGGLGLSRQPQLTGPMAALCAST